ncbi:exodeoxyribonuclease III [Lentiprolixibacter aurantiacus]|uniref:Exodeoxyribonuclease III n=1 Tax=Lentiprolixibacter aurantiacus TaxID=2993939 RepID=A0AAE3MNX9_9FLAO|nr:exodeoxyribonuclease III [Lentiprolixibacter aurantiacus]MCX2720741.1 exodeoxyribonuclease III [Lentiprolixibacter aurantiacus]
MKIVSWNVNGVRAVIKKDFFKSLEELDWDVLCLQETKAQDKEVAAALSPYQKYHHIYNSALKKGYSGTTLISKIPFQSHSLDMGVAEFDEEGRIICAEYSAFFLVNVYVPNSGQKLERLEYRKAWDAAFLTYLKNLESKKPVVVCGDFNVAHGPIDLKNDKTNYNKTAGYTQIEIDGMENYLQEGFIDTYRSLYPDNVAYTYWSYRFKARERNTGWRIDYFLISKSLLPKLQEVEILSEIYGSDHCPLRMVLN